MGFIFALSSQGQLPEPLGPEGTALAGHFLVYAILAVLLWWGLARRGPTAAWPLVLAFMGAMAFGLSDEWHQAFVPGRTASLRDLGVDALGALCALTAVGFWGASGGKTRNARVMRMPGGSTCDSSDTICRPVPQARDQGARRVAAAQAQPERR